MAKVTVVNAAPIVPALKPGQVWMRTKSGEKYLSVRAASGNIVLSNITSEFAEFWAQDGFGAGGYAVDFEYLGKVHEVIVTKL